MSVLTLNAISSIRDPGLVYVLSCTSFCVKFVDYNLFSWELSYHKYYNLTGDFKPVPIGVLVAKFCYKYTFSTGKDTFTAHN